YLLCPIYNFTVRGVYGLFNKGRRKFSRDLTVAKAVGTVVSLLFMFVVVIGILWMIIPGLVDSIANIIDILPASMDSLKLWLDSKLAGFPEARMTFDRWINNFTENAVNFVTETVLPEYTSIATSVSEGLIGILNIIKNLFVAIIICAYFLNSKDTFAAQMKKIIIATFKEERAQEILAGATFTNKTFGGFINGKLIDSLIIGLICFVVMTIFGWEYSLLISCIIGITNIIPFFGPFIGAIPSALLLLMVDTGQCISFLIFILILQQFDGNILGPKILGDSTGLASFWVLFAVLVGGGLFGFIGMVVGIPIFAVIYAYVSRGINRKLERRGFSTDLSDYKIDSYRVKTG
ncbi:MAG: AI-2E family transporter, partial [Bacillota bacterium]|nr:AI-2E family transporter [Bacillota bacterium]